MSGRLNEVMDELDEKEAIIERGEEYVETLQSRLEELEEQNAMLQAKELMRKQEYGERVNRLQDELQAKMDMIERGTDIVADLQSHIADLEKTRHGHVVMESGDYGELNPEDETEPPADDR